MIHAQDLRIGNHILFDGQEDVVKEIVTDYGDNTFRPLIGGRTHYRYYEERVSPIPLSAEILLACGFAKIQEGNMAYPEVWRIKYTHVLVETNFDLQSRDTGEYKWIEGNTIADVDSLHQLMNLVHSLTGRELVYSHSK